MNTACLFNAGVCGRVDARKCLARRIHSTRVHVKYRRHKDVGNTLAAATGFIRCLIFKGLKISKSIALDAVNTETSAVFNQKMKRTSSAGVLSVFVAYTGQPQAPGLMVRPPQAAPNSSPRATARWWAACMASINSALTC